MFIDKTNIDFKITQFVQKDSSRRRMDYWWKSSG